MRNSYFKFVTLSFLFFTYSSFSGLHLDPPLTEPEVSLEARKNKAADRAKPLQSNVKKNLDLQTNTATNNLTKKFFQSRNFRPAKDQKLPINQVNSPNEVSNFKKSITQFIESLNGKKTTPDQAATASVSTSLGDEELAKKLQLEEYSHQGAIFKGNDSEYETENYGATGLGAYASNETSNWRKHEFDGSIPIEYFNAFDLETSDSGECYCCGLSKCIPANTEMFLDDVFMSKCQRHHTKREGQDYLVMYHGTTNDTLESFLKEHIQPEGSGDLGQGFYVTSDFKFAHEHSLRRFQEKRASQLTKPIHPLVMEILVPCGLFAKNYDQKPHKGKAQIERHYNIDCRHKFVIRASILKELIINKLFFPTN